MFRYRSKAKPAPPQKSTPLTSTSRVLTPAPRKRCSNLTQQSTTVRALRRPLSRTRVRPSAPNCTSASHCVGGLGGKVSMRFVTVERKPHFEAGFAGLGFKFDFSAMPVGHDAIADDEAKPGAGADRFGGVKWLEHVRLDIRGYSRSVVHDF